MILPKEKLYFLGGGTGTEILRRGFPTKLPLWGTQVLFDKPELLKQIHLDYILAGADIITTNTFRTQRYVLAKAGLEAETERVNRLAVDIAVQARDEAKVNRPIYIAGGMTTIEDCRSESSLSLEILKREHTHQAELLASTPIDFFLLETFNGITEAKIAAEAVYSTGKPFMISFTANAQGDILNGDTWEDAIQQLLPFSPMAILVNCVSCPVATQALGKIKNSTNLPFGAYGNGPGIADEVDGWKLKSANQINEYLEHCHHWVELGATFIGGCCGTTPEYTKAYSQLRKQED